MRVAEPVRKCTRCGKGLWSFAEIIRYLDDSRLGVQFERGKVHVSRLFANLLANVFWTISMRAGEPIRTSAPLHGTPSNVASTLARFDPNARST